MTTRGRPWLDLHHLWCFGGWCGYGTRVRGADFSATLGGRGVGPDGARTCCPACVGALRRNPGQHRKVEPNHGGRAGTLLPGAYRVEDLADARRLRLVEAEEGIPGIL